MIYNILAQYYDGLVKDEKATRDWVTFIQKHLSGNEIMELACGSGEITLALAQQGYQIDASDFSFAMIEEAMKKANSEKVNFYVMDMNEMQSQKQYDGILCLCDSINYLLQETQLKTLFKNIYETLKPQGVFIFDMHTPDRLKEFEEEFYEEGVVEGHEYTWSIITEEDCLYHNFIFYDEEAHITQEQHIQRVYSIDLMNELLNPYFDIEIYTDFIEKGIHEGEKYFYICRKKG